MLMINPMVGVAGLNLYQPESIDGACVTLFGMDIKIGGMTVPFTSSTSPLAAKLPEWTSVVREITYTFNGPMLFVVQPSGTCPVQASNPPFINWASAEMPKQRRNASVNFRSMEKLFWYIESRTARPIGIG